MKRKALLIGYSGYDTDNKLSAVERDLDAFKDFLMSAKGGYWNNSEIDTIIDKNLKLLPMKLMLTKAMDYDIVLTVYSGHGGYDTELGCRCIGISDNDYSITEVDFENLGKRVISIFDSCSTAINESANESLDEFYKGIHDYIRNPDERKRIRETYEKKWLDCLEQKNMLYAAHFGEEARASKYESYYLSELLKVLKNAEQTINIIDAHNIATKLTTKRYQKQHPDLRIIPRNIKEYLPGAIVI